MPRYRFRWENVPSGVLEALSEGLGLTHDSPADALRLAYGARPRPDFVRDAWPILLEAWILKAPSLRRVIVDELRECRLGDCGAPIRSARDQEAYLASCRNAMTLREVVLEHFIEMGEQGVPAPPRPEPAPSAPPPRLEVEETTGGQSPVSSEPPQSLSDWVEEVVRSYLEVSEVERDSDGDIVVSGNGSVCFVSVLQDGDAPNLVSLCAPLVTSAESSSELLRWLNAQAGRYRVLKLLHTDANEVVLIADLLADSMNATELTWTIGYLTHCASRLADGICDRFGGQRFSQEETAV